MAKKYSFIAGSLCQSGDRFLRAGYKESALTVPEVLREMDKRRVAQGAEIHHRCTESPEDVQKLREALGTLKVSFVNAWTYGERKWRFGSLSAVDRATRMEAVARCKATVDYARLLDAPGVSLWLGQDGFDYAFQTDYRAQWDALLDSLREVCDYAGAMPVALEPKPREPRNRSLVDSVQTALLLRVESGRDNLGVTLDTGHAICAGQSAAASLALAMRYGALYNLHLNDNYGAWDDDMIVGSVHLNEMLEIFYLLEKYHYGGYLSVDIFPYRENAFDAVEESIRCMMDYERVIERLGVETVDALIAKGDVPATLRAVRNAVFGGLPA